MNDTSKGSRLGARIRRLRRHQGMTQAALAGQLGISASYLNLIEQNRRNVTADLLLRLARVFDLQLGDFAPDDDARLHGDVMEALGDPVFADHDIKTTDVADFLQASPALAKAMLTLFDAYRGTAADLASLRERLTAEAGLPDDLAEARMPAEMVSDFIQDRGNYFETLEAGAERIAREAGLDSPMDSYARLSAYLQTRLGVRVALLPPALRHGTIRRYDPVARTLIVSDALPLHGRNFQLAQQIGLIALSREIDALLDEGGIAEGEARPLGRIALANYAAAALLMPYDPFIELTRRVRYDIEQLEHHFGASFEQVCHRLTTLQRPGNQGVPLHLLRVDIAGNISKRFSLSGLRIPRHSGACPRWNIYAALMTLGRIHTQVSEMPDRSAYFCIARAIRKRGGGFGEPESIYAIGLGCALEHARSLVYADGIDLASLDRRAPAGIACRICERTDCRQRAFPPLHRPMRLDENVRGVSPYVSTPRGTNGG
ncbi:MAG: short-chain fatty acyl-CoA regulator family protein [Alphaproteobacteria bacterium]